MASREEVQSAAHHILLDLHDEIHSGSFRGYSVAILGLFGSQGCLRDD